MFLDNIYPQFIFNKNLLFLSKVNASLLIKTKENERCLRKTKK